MIHVCFFPGSWQTLLLTRFLFISMDLSRRSPEPSGTPHTSCAGKTLWFKVRVSVGEYSLAQVC